MTITHVFFDIGGVLATNGWDRNDRREAAAHFAIDLDDYTRRHDEIVAAFEEGRLTLDEYLDRSVFIKPRSFTPEDFKAFMYRQSKPFPHSLAVARALCASKSVRMCIASNESEELSRYRMRLFGLTEIFDTFLASCWIGVRKPAPNFFERCVEVTAARAEQSLFIDDREENIAAAAAFGFKVILFQSAEQLRRALAASGLELNIQHG
ncbi:MAG TPA: HAD family phosphatase [Gemmatimonadaceae bacterium]|nr:HAD family phosphatase [Gemmatimonadaceae bacterium]